MGARVVQVCMCAYVRMHVCVHAYACLKAMI